MVSGATKTMQKYKGNPYLGAFLTPRTGNSLKTMDGFVWASDNAAFNQFDEIAFVKMLEKIRGTETKFVCCPDVVGDGEKTLILFFNWYKIVKSYNVPVALVLQNGMTKEQIPFDLIDAVFIGGDNNFKLGRIVREIVIEAKKREIWIHMGRVNSNKRIEYAYELGCDSIDGSGFSMFPEKRIPNALCFLNDLHSRGELF